MRVTFFTVEKKQNSTKLPTSSGTNYECIIKDNCSVLSPVIKLDIGLVASPSQFNYAYIPAWNRYYFVNDWVFSSRLWKAQLSVDVLSTYKTAIGNYEGYVLRSSSNYSGDIVDTTYPQKVGLTGYSNKIRYSGLGTYTSYHTWKLGDSTKYIGILRSFQDFELSDGYFYVTMLCTTSGSANKYNIYVMDYDNYASFITALFNTDYSSYSKGSISNDVYKYLVDPLQYIVSVKWCPFRVPGYTLTSQTLAFGSLSLNTYTVTCAEVTEALGMRISYLIDTIPAHPDYTSRGKWVNQEPYIYVDLDVQPFGNVSLDRAKIPVTDSATKSGTVCLVWDVDIHTGDAILNVYGTDSQQYNADQYGPLLATMTGNYMVDVPLAQTRVSPLGIIGGIVNAIGTSVNSNASDIATSTMSSTNQTPYQQTHIMGVPVDNSQEFVESLLGDDYQASVDKATSNIESTWGSIGTVASNIGNVLTGTSTTVSSRGVQGAYVGIRDPFINCWWTSMVDEDNEHSGRPYCKKVKLNTLSGFILCRDGDISLNATQQEKGLVGKYLTSGFFYE